MGAAAWTEAGELPWDLGMSGREGQECGLWCCSCAAAPAPQGSLLQGSDDHSSDPLGWESEFASSISSCLGAAPRAGSVLLLVTGVMEMEL